MPGLTATTISKRALLARINRKLNHEDNAEILEAAGWKGFPSWTVRLRKSRGWREQNNLGDFYLLEEYRNIVEYTHVSPETLGRDLGVMANDEQLETAEQGEAA